MRSLADERATPRRARMRRVRRTVRRFDLWAVLRFAIVFYLCVFVILLVAGVLLWIGAREAGVIDNVEDFIEELFALRDYRLVGRDALLYGTLVGGSLMLLGTLVTVVGAMLYNLIGALIGGIEVEVFEHEESQTVV